MAETNIDSNQVVSSASTSASAQSASGDSKPFDINTATFLYVGDLAPNVTEAILFEVFNPIAPVTNIKVCRDSNTRASLGYAYVNFQTHADAEKVMDAMNYSPIKDKPCRISWPIRDSNVRKSTTGNVFIKNLDPTIDDRALYDTFSLFGRILSCKVVKDNSNVSKGYGFVHFESPQAAETAIEKINGMLISGREVYVGHFIKHNERTQNVQYTNIYVKSVPTHWDEKRLKDLFSECGEIKSVAISKNDDGKSKGFGFIDFVEHEAAAKAIEKFNEFEVKTKEGEDDSSNPTESGNSDVIPTSTRLSQKLIVCRAQKKAERVRELQVKYEQAKKERIAKYQGVNLFIKDLDESIDDDILRKEFAVYGTITSARIMRDEVPLSAATTDSKKPVGKSKGFGFVCFSTPEEATKAVTEMNGKELAGKKIYVGLAQTKEIRQAQLMAQNAGRGPLNMQMPNQGMYPGPQMFFPPRGTNPYQFMQQQMIPRGMVNGMQMMPGRNMIPGRMQPNMMQPGFPMQQMGNFNQRGPMNMNARGPRGMQARQNQMPGQNQMRGNVRNQPMMQNGQPMMMMQNQGMMPMPIQQIPTPVQAAPLTAAALANASEEEQKNMIGERLFPLIAKVVPDLAGKITGMLLEMENPELLHLLEAPDALRVKIDEAIKTLEAHGQ